MTIAEQVKADMDAVENTHAHRFLDRLYRNAIYWTNDSPRKNLLDQLKEWFNMTVPLQGFDPESDEHTFLDAMLRGKTCCAALYLLRILNNSKENGEFNEYREWFERKIQLLVWAAIGDGSFTPTDPITRLSMMFTEDLDMGVDLFTAYGKKFLDMLAITDSSCAATDKLVKEAVTWLITERFGTHVEIGNAPVNLRDEKADGKEKLFIHRVTGNVPSVSIN